MGTVTTMDRNDLAIIMGGIKCLQEEIQIVKAFNYQLLELLCQQQGLELKAQLLESESKLGAYLMECEKRMQSRIAEEIRAINDERLT